MAYNTGINLTMPSMGSGFGTIGLCTSVGINTLTAGAGVLFGSVFGIAGYYVLNDAATQGVYDPGLVVSGAIGLGVATGLISALGVYFTCKGVSYGVPVRSRK